MNDYICPYCAKTYKTEKGLAKHLEKCVKKQNYDLLSNYPDLFANMNLVCRYLYKKKYYSLMNKQLFMANDRNFTKIKNFTDYEIGVGLYSKIYNLGILIFFKVLYIKFC